MSEGALPPPPGDFDESLPLRTKKRSLAPPAAAPPRAAPPKEGALARVLDRMRRTRLALAGLVVVGMLGLVAVFADVLASEMPIVCNIHGHVYVLPSVTRPPALEGWDNARVHAEHADGDWAILPLVAYGPRQAGTTAGELAPLRPPFATVSHPLGTDAYGRDVFARLVHGARTSMSLALLAVLAFIGLGTALGALAGFFGGPVDVAVARVVETLTAFPSLVLVLVVQATVPHPTVTTLLAALALTRWTEVARLVRAEVLLVASQDYVLAARALGASPARILFRHIAPNAQAPVVVSATFGLASVVLIEAALAFLRVGLPGSVASWGEMLSQSRDHLGAWWLLVLPGVSLFVSVVALNLVGEALRDALDPRLYTATPGHEGA